jgi:hypothetical protein
VRTPAELFADATELATAGRTARWLDELVADGTLTDSQRVNIAAEDGAATLTTLLRRVELAGRDPRQILTDAVSRRSLDDARQITNVLHRRITQTTDLDPVGTTYTDWMPRVDDPRWSAYLTTLADLADRRRSELGRRVGAEAPQWAVEALGLPPEAGTRARDEWDTNAAAAAAYRELVGHDDPADALGSAPKPGQAEAYASWRAAWRALGRPEADRAEAEMSTGQLRVRIRAYDREQIWGPPYVANELAGTRQTADKHRQDAAVRRAEAVAAARVGDHETHLQRQREATEAAALAAALEARAAELEQADEARARWYAHTAETRAAADRARAELSSRGAASEVVAEEQPAVSVEEWLAAHEAATRAEDPHREITADHDLADVDEARERDQYTAVPADQASTVSDPAVRVGKHDEVDSTPDSPDEPQVDAATEPGAKSVISDDSPDLDDNDVSGAGRPAPGARSVAGHEPGPAPRDIRQEAAGEPARDDGHDAETVRVPTAEETAESVRRAQRALTELRNRQAAEDQRAADEARDEELARWHTDIAETADGRSIEAAAAAETDFVSDSRAETDTVERVDDSRTDDVPVLEIGQADDY